MIKLSSNISIGSHKLSNASPVYVIAEMACAHQGSLDNAFKLIDSAVNAKADCIQLQIFDTESNMVPSAPIYNLLKSLL